MTSAKGSLPLGVGVDPQTRRVMEQLIEKTDVNEGLRGDPLDRGLKVRDLIDLGLAKSLSRNAQRLVSGGNLQPTIAAPDLAVPPAPTGFSVTGGFSHIFLSWDNPQELYRNHSYTVIYRNTVDNVANAVAIAQVATGSLYADLDVSYGSTYYYWIRFVSEADITGAYNSSVGLFAKLSEDPAQLLARLEGEIRETHLFADLNARINLIDSDGTGLVTLVQVQSQVIDSLNASYSVKI
jgi:predicted phage tail protein